jgi:hypothetical protein
MFPHYVSPLYPFPLSSPPLTNTFSCRCGHQFCYLCGKKWKRCLVRYSTRNIFCVMVSRVWGKRLSFADMCGSSMRVRLVRATNALVFQELCGAVFVPLRCARDASTIVTGCRSGEDIQALLSFGTAKQPDACGNAKPWDSHGPVGRTIESMRSLRFLRRVRMEDWGILLGNYILS